jgi:hypothetical protein
VAKARLIQLVALLAAVGSALVGGSGNGLIWPP